MSRSARLALLFLVLGLSFAVPDTARAQVADGGGCAGQFDTDICIACTGVGYPLTTHSNFFVNDFTTVDPYGYGSLYLCIDGVGCYYKYTAFTDHYGEYPTAYHQVYGTGQATTEVDFYSYTSSYLTTGVSPVQYWFP